MAVVTLSNKSNVSQLLPAFPGMAVAYTPSDDDTFDAPVTVYVGGAGDVEIIPANGSAAVVFAGLSAGQVVPCRAKAVLAANTTATDIVIVY